MGGLVVGRRSFVLLGIGVVVVAAVAFALTRGGDDPEASVDPCFTLSLAPTPTSGGSFEATVEARPGCAEGELLGGKYLELRDDDGTVAYLESPNRVLPAETDSFVAAGYMVEQPQSFKLPELDEGRYAVCANFTDEPERTLDAEQHEACATFEVS
ncbi:MAG: hypothetical protein ACR2H3_03110 [Acidimicrobiales bacterium]